MGKKHADTYDGPTTPAATLAMARPHWGGGGDDSWLHVRSGLSDLLTGTHRGDFCTWKKQKNQPHAREPATDLDRRVRPRIYESASSLAFASIIATAPVVAAAQAKPAAQSKPKPAPPKTTVKRAPRAPVKPAPPAQLGITTPSGLTYVITARGKGRRPKTGETVLVHYTGTLTDGTKFDSSQDRKEPIAFPLGRGAVIKGWDEGIARMGMGDSAVLIIPPQLGRRKGAKRRIPPDDTMGSWSPGGHQEKRCPPDAEPIEERGIEASPSILYRSMKDAAGRSLQNEGVPRAQLTVVGAQAGPWKRSRPQCERSRPIALGEPSTQPRRRYWSRRAALAIQKYEKSCRSTREHKTPLSSES